MRLNPRIIQLFGDALIPLLGYFWWNWSLYFIVLFYLMDYLSNEVFTYLKAKKIVSFQQINSQKWIKSGIISSVLLLICFIIIHLAIRSIHPEIYFTQEIMDFWTYKDMGFEQGYILIPLIVLVGFQRYKLEFIATRKYETLKIESLWKPHINSHYFILGGAALIIGISTFIVFPELVYILGIILFSTIYQLFVKKG